MNIRRLVDRIVTRLMIFIMGILVIDVVWQVMSRYLLQSPSSFTDELAGFLLIWVGLLGAAYAVGIRKHLAIDYFIHNASPRKKRLIEIFHAGLIILFAAAVMIGGGTWLVYTRFYLGQISPALQMPLGAVYIILPLSGALIIYYAFDNLLKQSPDQEK